LKREIGRRMLRLKELKSLPSNIAIDTGPLLLPITREPGWSKIRKLLRMHEEGEVLLHIGLFNISELVYAMLRLGYDMKTSLRYAALIYERLKVIKNSQYATWMGKLRAKAYELNYSIPWGDISSAAVAVYMNIPVLALDKDKHFDKLSTICRKLNKQIQIIHVGEITAT